MSTCETPHKKFNCGKQKSFTIKAWTVMCLRPVWSTSCWWKGCKIHLGVLGDIHKIYKTLCIMCCHHKVVYQQINKRLHFQCYKARMCVVWPWHTIFITPVGTETWQTEHRCQVLFPYKVPRVQSKWVYHKGEKWSTAKATVIFPINCGLNWFHSRRIGWTHWWQTVGYASVELV